MSTEERLKQLILDRYGSIREFTIKAGIPYSTLDTILKRGIQKATVYNVITICSALQISADALAEGKIEPFKNKTNNIDIMDQLKTALTYIQNTEDSIYLDGKECNEETLTYVYNSIEICIEMIKKRQK